MLVREARDVARQWVEEEANRLPGFAGAFFSGSVAAMPDDAVLPPSSDVDVNVVLDRSDLPADTRKFVYHDVILEVSAGPLAHLRSSEAVLANYFTAIHFTTPGIIADPSGHLTALQPAVARAYPQRRWVRARCAHARDSFLTSLGGVDEAAPLPAQVIGWLYAFLMLTHVALVADLRNPTVRKALIVTRDVCTAYGRADVQERLLDILGSAALSRAQVEALLAACAEAFDAVQGVHRTRFIYDANILGLSRPAAIDATGQLIRGGAHREVVFWIAAIHSWCQIAFQNDAPLAVRAQFDPPYQQLLTQLGLTAPGAVARRTAQLRALLPDVWRMTEEIIATSPAIVD